MKKAVLVFSIVLVFFSLNLIAGDPANVPSITVVGEATQTTPPDYLEVSIYMEVRCPDIPTAKKQIEQKMIKLSALFTKFNLKPEDYKIHPLSTTDWFNDQNQGKDLAFYSMSQSIDVVLRDVSKLSSFQSDLMELGIATIPLVISKTSKMDDISKEALLKALHDARGKAIVLAFEEGMSLGPVIKIYEGTPESFEPSLIVTGGPPSYKMNGLITTAEDVVIAKKVTVTYQLLPKK